MSRVQMFMFCRPPLSVDFRRRYLRKVRMPTSSSRPEPLHDVRWQTLGTFTTPFCLECQAMATRGVFQLRKLTVKYCDHSGSSKGAREFIRHRIVEFANKTPAAEVATELRPGQHPYIMGDYVTGEVKTIGIKNIAPGEIMDYALMLRNSSGRKV